jgi:hypothetical protein
MYADITESLVGTSGSLTELATEVGSMLTSVAPIAIPVVGAVALFFFGIKIFRGMIHV